MAKKALLVVDVQNDFCPGGALAVKDGDKVVGPLNTMIRYARKNGWILAASRDWHPKETSHFDTWPAHCVQGSDGARFHKDLQRQGLYTFSKGTKPNEDGYSAFDGTLTAREDGTTLLEFLRFFRVTDLFVGGLATDYCVKATVLDAIRHGFKVTVLIDACRAVNRNPEDEQNAIAEMIAAGAITITTQETLKNEMGK